MSRYGIRALFDIAYNATGQSTQVKHIAERQGISPRYIEQIFQRLKRAGLIRSIRGPSGGFYLARKAEEIRLGDIIRATERSLDLVPCSTKQQRCERMAECVVADVWKGASDRLNEYFDSITLKDLCESARGRGITCVSDKSLMYHI